MTDDNGRVIKAQIINSDDEIVNVYEDDQEEEENDEDSWAVEDDDAGEKEEEEGDDDETPPFIEISGCVVEVVRAFHTAYTLDIFPALTAKIVKFWPLPASRKAHEGSLPKELASTIEVVGFFPFTTPFKVYTFKMDPASRKMIDLFTVQDSLAALKYFKTTPPKADVSRHGVKRLTRGRVRAMLKFKFPEVNKPAVFKQIVDVFPKNDEEAVQSPPDWTVLRGPLDRFRIYMIDQLDGAFIDSSLYLLRNVLPEYAFHSMTETQLAHLFQAFVEDPFIILFHTTLARHFPPHIVARLSSPTQVKRTAPGLLRILLEMENKQHLDRADTVVEAAELCARVRRFTQKGHTAYPVKPEMVEAVERACDVEVGGKPVLSMQEIGRWSYDATQQQWRVVEGLVCGSHDQMKKEREAAGFLGDMIADAGGRFGNAGVALAQPLTGDEVLLAQKDRAAVNAGKRALYQPLTIWNLPTHCYTDRLAVFLPFLAKSVVDQDGRLVVVFPPKSQALLPSLGHMRRDRSLMQTNRQRSVSGKGWWLVTSPETPVFAKHARNATHIVVMESHRVPVSTLHRIIGAKTMGTSDGRKTALETLCLTLIGDAIQVCGDGNGWFADLAMSRDALKSTVWRAGGHAADAAASIMEPGKRTAAHFTDPYLTDLWKLGLESSLFVGTRAFRAVEECTALTKLTDTYATFDRDRIKVAEDAADIMELFVETDIPPVVVAFRDDDGDEDVVRSIVEEMRSDPKHGTWSVMAVDSDDCARLSKVLYNEEFWIAPSVIYRRGDTIKHDYKEQMHTSDRIVAINVNVNERWRSAPNFRILSGPGKINYSTKGVDFRKVYTGRMANPHIVSANLVHTKQIIMNRHEMKLQHYAYVATDKNDNYLQGFGTAFGRGPTPRDRCQNISLCDMNRDDIPTVDTVILVLPETNERAEFRARFAHLWSAATRARKRLIVVTPTEVEFSAMVANNARRTYVTSFAHALRNLAPSN